MTPLSVDDDLADVQALLADARLLLRRAQTSIDRDEVLMAQSRALVTECRALLSRFVDPAAPPADPRKRFPSPLVGEGGAHGEAMGG